MSKKLVKVTLMVVMALGSTTMMTSCQKDIETAVDGLFKPLNDKLDKWEAERKVQHLVNLQNWTNGETDEEAIKKFGYENCFKIVPVSDNYWGDNRSVALSPNVDKENLCEVRSLCYTTFGNARHEIHVGSLICDKRIANDLLNIFRTLYEEKYPVFELTKGYDFTWHQLIDCNFTFCYYYDIHQPDSADLLQQQGFVVILNPANPPANGHDRAVELFRQHGFTWCGERDYNCRYRFERQL